MRVASAFQNSRSNGGVLAHQVAVDHDDQIRSLARSMLKVVGHLGAFEIALLAHHLLDACELLLVDEDAELARLGEVDQRG